jgi:phosphoglucosamine mutase
MNNNLFGTDGIRNRVGNSPFNLPDLAKLGLAIGQWALEKYGPQAAILIAQDTRISGNWVISALESGLLMHPIALYNAHILPTPALSYIMHKKSTYSCAIMISASHNQYQDNGIKIIDALSGKLSKSDEISISKLFYDISQELNYQHFGTSQSSPDSAQIYEQLVKAQFQANFLNNKHIVLDTAHGATYRVAPEIFRQLGAQVTVINNTPTGTNINDKSGSLHVELLQKTVLETKADAGFAFDGDGDRVIAVSKTGEIKNGDDLLALLSNHPDYINQDTIVGTVMSNQGFEVYLNKKNKKLIRTAVGDKYVLEALVHDNLLLGGEQSGHIILRNIINTGDGILVALKVLESVLYTNNWNLTTFTKYPQILLNVPVKARHDLSQEPFAQLIKQAEEKIPDGRLLVRYSGTEALLRIMVEDPNENLARTLADNLAKQLTEKLV